MKHDRYLIYTMNGKHVCSEIPKRFGGFLLNGVVEKVYRDVIEKSISIKIKNKAYVFREPNTIVLVSDDEIVFVYGNVDEEQVSDEQLFDELKRVSLRGGNIDDALQNLNSDSVTLIVFKLKESENAEKNLSGGKRRRTKKSTTRNAKSQTNEEASKSKRKGTKKSVPKKQTERVPASKRSKLKSKQKRSPIGKKKVVRSKKKETQKKRAK